MVIRMESKNGDVLKGIDQVRAEIQRRLQLHPEQWLQALQKNPGNFADLEQTVHQAFQQMADQMVAGLLAQATQATEFAQAAKSVTAKAAVKLRSGEVRPLLVRLLGGLVLYVTTLYCSPAARTGKKPRPRRSGLVSRIGSAGDTGREEPCPECEVGRPTAAVALL